MAPTPRSYQQRLGDLMNAVFAKTNLTGLRVGGPALSMLEAAASSGTRDTSDVFDALNASDPTRLRGEQLERYGRSRGVRRPGAVAARTEVTISDSSFSKKASLLSPLATPPIPGQTSVWVASALSFPSSGSIYVGRGTASYEGPIPYSSKTDNGSDWTLTLSAPIARRHDGSEEVVVAQGGDRPIPAGTVLQTQQGNALAAASFTVLSGTSIPDGEVELVGVEVLCTQRGEVGNVPAEAISSFPSPPFSGAAATNPRQVTTGRNVAQDPEYLALIMAQEASRSRGTPLSLEQYSLQVTAPDESATCTSASYVDRRGDEPAVITVDDGTGYQPTEAAVGRESLVGSATGGEVDFELSSGPIVKARAETTVPPPWGIAPGSALAFEVGGIVTEHVLDPSSYPNQADPYAVASDCNSDSRLNWEAVVSDRGQAIRFRAKTELGEEIRSVPPPGGGPDAASVLGISQLTEATALIYLNDRLLHRGGRPAVLASRPFGQWGAVSGTQTLSIDVDGTGSVTYSFSDADFAGTGYSSVGRNSPGAWATAIRRRVPGLAPAVSSDLLLLVSNAGPSSAASVAVSGGTLVAAGFFAVGSASGLDNDFYLNRSTAQLRLSAPLEPGDSLSAGSDQTRAFAEAVIPGAVTLSAPANWWIAVDSSATNLLLGANASTTYSAAVPAGGARPWGDRLRLSAAAGTFSGLSIGDYATFWDPSSPSSIYGAWIVASVAGDGSWFELDRRQGGCLRDRAASCVLADGRIFACGGYALDSRQLPLRSAEIFDPATKRWIQVPNLMAKPRADHWAVLLPSGKVLVGGGDPLSSGGPELFDPGTGLFAATSSANAPTVALGQKASVLGAIAYVAGGNTGPATYLAGTWEYDEGADTWAVGGSLSAARSRHTLTSYDGFVWAVCGEDAASTLSTVEAYDPGTHTWAAAGAITARQSHAASVSGTTLIVTGGSANRDSGTQTRLTNCDIYPAGGPWTVGPAMTYGRSYHAQVTLTGGKVLAAGGEASVVGSEVLDLGGPSWATAGIPPWASSPNSLIGHDTGGDTAVATFGRAPQPPPVPEKPTAQSHTFDLGTTSWSSDDPLNGTSFSLTAGGLSFSRAEGRLSRRTIPAATDLTATSLQAVLGSSDSSSDTVDRVQTVKLRWRTNTWGTAPETGNAPPGEMMVAAQDDQAELVGFPEGEPDGGSAGQQAWILSGNPQAGTPTFRYSIVVGSRGDELPILSWPFLADKATWPGPSAWIRGLGGEGDSYGQPRAGQLRGYFSQLRERAMDASSPGGIYGLTVSPPEQGWQPGDRVSICSPWHLGPQDYLSLVLDRNAGQKSFSPRTYRRLRPANTPYGQVNSYVDADLAPPASLGLSFGTSYDFRDHAVMMRARTLIFGADPSRRILWRWWQHGRGGELVDAVYANPSGPSLPASVAVDATSGGRILAQIRLASGAPKTGALVRSSTVVGVAAPAVSAGIASVVVVVGLPIVVAIRVANVTTMTLGTPPGVTGHGLLPGQVIYVESTDPNFSSGLKTITAVLGLNVSYAEVAPNVAATPNIGNVSRDAGPCRVDTWSPAPAVGDWLLISSSSSVPAPFSGRTMRMSSTGGPQYLEAKLDNFPDPPSVVLSWGSLNDPDFLLGFANPQQSASAIATAIHADFLAGSSPLDPTVVGTGAGIISMSSYEEFGSSGTRFPLRDGINAVSDQVNPALPALNYSLTLRDPVSPSLALDSDWLNEDVRLVPTSAAAVARWLNSPATSGFGAAGVAEAASRGERLQLSSSQPGSAGAIQVVGGSANAWSAEVIGESASGLGGAAALIRVPASSPAGFCADAWLAVDLNRPADRGVFSPASDLLSIQADGELTLAAPSPVLWQAPPGVSGSQTGIGVAVEAEGRFVRYQDLGVGAFLGVGSALEGAWVIVSPPAAPVGTPVKAANCGMFRVVRSSSDGGVGRHCFWVEATTHAPEYMAEANFRFLADGSVLPGDVITLGPDWGASNAGSWTVTGLGDDGGGPYSNQRTVNLDTTTRSPTPTFGPAVIGANYPLYRAVPVSPQRWIKRILASWPEGSDAILAVSGSHGWEDISESGGARLVALDKLEFSTNLATGRGAYRYHTGLVGEVNKVLVGSSYDPVSYPGVASAGSLLVVDGPKIRRTYFAVQVTLRQGYSANDVTRAIQDAIAASVEDRPHGRPIPVSDLISKAAAVSGVRAVVPLSPYDSANYYLPVFPGERARVLFPESDISVSVIL